MKNVASEDFHSFANLRSDSTLHVSECSVTPPPPHFTSTRLFAADWAGIFHWDFGNKINTEEDVVKDFSFNLTFSRD